MEYDQLIRDAWAMTWRYRFLWLLGLLAGGAVGLPSLHGGGGAHTGSRGAGQANPALDAAARQVGAWAIANVGLLIGAAALAAVLVLVVLVLSLIAQGGMAQATADLATGQTSSLRRAWDAGLRLFWRYVGLWLVLALAAIGVGAGIALVAAEVVALMTVLHAPIIGVGLIAAVCAAIIVSFVALVLALARATTAPRWLIGAVATLFALPVFTVLIVAALGLSIVVAFAQRAIAVEDVGPLAALRSGWRLLRLHLGASAITWLVNVGLAIATMLAGAAGVLGALVVLGGVGALLFAVAGPSAPTLVYAALGGVALVAFALTVLGIANTFLWSYWTLAYLRLSGRTATPAGA